MIAIGRLAISLRPSDPVGTEFMILTAYYDESGTRAGSPLTVLGGIVGAATNWVDFEIEWRKILKKHNITHVHAKHLFHRQGEFKDWTAPSLKGHRDFRGGGGLPIHGVTSWESSQVRKASTAIGRRLRETLMAWALESPPPSNERPTNRP